MNTIETLSAVIDEIEKKVPDFVDHTIKLIKPGLFGKLKQVNRPKEFYITWQTANGGAVQGYDLDSTTDSLGETATPVVVQGNDRLYTVLGLHKLTEEAINQGADNKYVIVNLAKQAVENASSALANALVRMFYLPFGTRNVVAQYTVGASDETVSTSGTALTLNVSPYAWFLKINDVVDIYDGSSKLGTAVVTNVAKGRKTVTLQAIGSNITLPASKTVDFYFQGMYNKPLNAYPYIADDSGTIHGVDRSTYPMFAGTVLDGTSYTNGLSIDAVRDLMSTITNLPYNIRIPDYTTAYTTYAQLQNLESDMLAQQLYIRDLRQQLDWGGWGLAVDGITIVYDEHVPPGQVFVPNFDSLELSKGVKKWVTEDGSKLIRWSTSQFQLYAVILYGDYQFASDNPVAQARIENLPNDFSFS